MRYQQKQDEMEWKQAGQGWRLTSNKEYTSCIKNEMKWTN